MRFMHLGCFIVFSLFSTVSSGDFLPPNNLHLELDEEGGGISKEEFNEVIDLAEDIYAPLISAHGGNLIFNRLWDNDTVNASANQQGNSWIVNMYGGLARRSEITKDGFSLVVCHELGHHLAGFPGYWGWASSEGQSDYFATISCARKLWFHQKEEHSQAAQNIPQIPKNMCDEVFFAEGQSRLDVCYRSMLGGKSMADLLGAAGRQDVSWDTPDESRVEVTSVRHPAAQCRLDTYVAGSLCKADFDPRIIPSTEREAAYNSCHRALGHVTGTRSRCWFKPTLFDQ